MVSKRSTITEQGNKGLPFSNASSIPVRTAPFSLLFLLLSLFLLEGCSENKEPSPQIHQKKYTIEELERKYRDIPKVPEGYGAEDSNSISSQKSAFYSNFKKTFKEIDQYKHDLASADRTASAREKKQRHKEKVKAERKKALKSAKAAPKSSGEVINDYYN